MWYDKHTDPIATSDLVTVSLQIYAHAFLFVVGMCLE